MRLDKQDSIALAKGEKQFVELFVSKCILRSERKHRKFFVSAIPQLVQKYPELLSQVLALPLEKSHYSGKLCMFHLICEEIEEVSRYPLQNTEMLVEGTSQETKKILWKTSHPSNTNDIKDPLVSAYVVPFPSLCGTEGTLHCT